MNERRDVDTSSDAFQQTVADTKARIERRIQEEDRALTEPKISGSQAVEIMSAIRRAFQSFEHVDEVLKIYAAAENLTAEYEKRRIDAQTGYAADAAAAAEAKTAAEAELATIIAQRDAAREEFSAEQSAHEKELRRIRDEVGEAARIRDGLQTAVEVLRASVATV